jgi:ribosomal protein S18 acetylase RimI-like enzyme
MEQKSNLFGEGGDFSQNLIIGTSFEGSKFPLIYALEMSCFREEFRWTKEILYREITRAISKDNFWIAYHGDQIAGYLLASEGKSKARIETVNIAPDYRRRGVASRLISVCEAEFKKRDFSKIRLEVSVDNPAQILYFNLGYRVNEFHKNYYHPGADALRMTKKL